MNCEECIFQPYTRATECIYCHENRPISQLFIVGTDDNYYYPILSGFNTLEEARSMLGAFDKTDINPHLATWHEETGAFVLLNQNTSSLD